MYSIFGSINNDKDACAGKKCFCRRVDRNPLCAALVLFAGKRQCWSIRFGFWLLLVAFKLALMFCHVRGLPQSGWLIELAFPADAKGAKGCVGLCWWTSAPGCCTYTRVAGQMHSGSANILLHNIKVGLLPSC